MNIDHSPSPSSLAQELAQALALEQVRYIKQQLFSNQNPTYIRNFISQSYQNADKIQLKNIIQLEQLNAVVEKYAFELNLGADILEFIGVVAQKIHHYAVHNKSIIHDLLSDETFELWLFKILELEQLKHYIQENLRHNPQIQQVSLQLANQILESNTPWLNQLRQYTVKQNRIGLKMVRFIQEQQQNIELKLEQQLASAIRKQLSNIILLPNEDLADIATYVWDEVKQRSLKEMFSQVQSIDFEEFFIVVYETWKELRETDFMQAIILNVVEAFYEYFGDYTLQELLHAVGLDENDLFIEAERFIPHSLNTLEQHGLLDGIIHSFIAPFYLDDKTHQFIQNFLAEKSAP